MAPILFIWPLRYLEIARQWSESRKDTRETIWTPFLRPTKRTWGFARIASGANQNNEKGNTFTWAHVDSTVPSNTLKL
jgi:hypothetical protein